MKNLNEIQKIVTEVIEGRDARLKELKKLTKEIFKDITQEEIEKIGKGNLKPLVDSYNILKKEKLTDIDRAFLNMYFNKNSEKYFTYNYTGEINWEKLKKFTREIHDTEISSKIFGKTEREFMAFIGWVLAYENFWDDIQIQNEKNDLQLEMDLNYLRKKPEMNLLIIGKRKPEHDRLIENIVKALK